MFLASLHLRNFRNFAEQVLEFPAAGVAIVGDNGQGKTNLLEAIYYLEIFRSFRGAPDEQLVRFGEEVFRVEGAMRDPAGAEREIAAAFDRRARRKKVTLNRSEPARLGDGIGRVGAVIFSPSDVTIVSGSPGARRRFLDIVLSLAVPGYLEALQRYRQTLLHRNSLLRQGVPLAQVEAWNEGLVQQGTQLIVARARWIAERRDSFGRHAEAISGGTAGRIEYDSSVRGWQTDKENTTSSSSRVDPIEVATVADAFRDELERVAERDQRRSATTVGPHRDDLRMLAAGDAPDSWLDLRVYGSGGQQRTAAVALRMTEAETIRDTRERQPVVLLDDVFAELDPGRANRILRWVEEEEGGQMILTAPKESDVEIRGGSLPRWRIQGGVVTVL